MIGLIASLLTAVITGNYILLLAPLIYAAALKSRDLALIAFYLYVLVMAFYFNPGSIYTLSGMEGVLMAFSTVIVLDEILSGVRFRIPSREEFLVLGALTVSAFTIYTFLPVLAAVTVYVIYRRFGKPVLYTMGWWLLLAASLYAARSRLMHRGAQALIIVGLALIFILIGERRDVKAVEVKLR
ncbi:hypothetical protein [Thermococcus sp.]